MKVLGLKIEVWIMQCFFNILHAEKPKEILKEDIASLNQEEN